jgi:hypothetical protein
MAKFYGEIGYADGQEELTPGVWTEKIITRKYAGDVLRNVSKMREGENLNDNLVLDNRLSIVADPFAYSNFYAMRYVDWMGAHWKIKSVEVQRPRLILTIGEVYNEQET